MGSLLVGAISPSGVGDKEEIITGCREVGGHVIIRLGIEVATLTEGSSPAIVGDKDGSLLSPLPSLLLSSLPSLSLPLSGGKDD